MGTKITQSLDTVTEIELSLPDSRTGERTAYLTVEGTGPSGSELVIRDANGQHIHGIDLNLFNHRSSTA